MVLTAHGSADPQSAANAQAVAARVRRMRPGLDVRVAFCEINQPSLIDVAGRVFRRSGRDSPAAGGRLPRPRRHPRPDRAQRRQLSLCDRPACSARTTVWFRCWVND